VLTLLFHDLGADRVLLTKRTDTVEHHKGQISFPGGGVDDDDIDLSATALRETWEEVGVDPEHVEIIGQLDEIVTISNFLVTPYVGVLHRTPYVWIPSDIEVAEVLEPPIAALLEDATLVLEERFVDGEAYVAPAYHWNGHRIWGATARMLHEFLDLLRGAPERLADIQQLSRL
jgi:8-oxo-dGTP pyrophosphatase MutT (NUDIX family)